MIAHGIRARQIDGAGAPDQRKVGLARMQSESRRVNPRVGRFTASFPLLLSGAVRSSGHLHRTPFARSSCESFPHVMIGAGRMRTGKVLTAFLPAGMLSRVERMARAEARTISELARETLRAYEGLRDGTPPDRRATANTPKNIGR